MIGIVQACHLKAFRSPYSLVLSQTGKKRQNSAGKSAGRHLGRSAIMTWEMALSVKMARGNENGQGSLYFKHNYSQKLCLLTMRHTGP